MGEKMKKKKYFILIFFTILLSGCNANYEVEFIDGKLNENVYLFTDNNSFIEKTDEELEDVAYQMYLFDEEYNNFERTLEFDENNAGFNYHTKFNLKENNDWPTVIKQCYEDIQIIEEKNSITIKTSNEFLCYDKFYELEDVSISFKTNYVVTDNNADNISSNKYIWQITEEEANYKPLYIKMQNKKIKTNKKENIIMPFAIGTFIIITITTIIISVKKRKKNNDF